MTKFKRGDRVAVYGVDSNYNPIRVQGVVTGYGGTDLLYVEGPNVIWGHLWDLSMPHVKQCRKLKPRVKKEPRRVWITESGLSKLSDKQCVHLRVSDFKIVPTDVEFIEVLKNDK